MCSPFWDNASCVPPTLAGQTAVFPCMKMYREKRYSQQCKLRLRIILEWCTMSDPDNASRDCFPNSTWAGLTDYSSCKLLEEPTSEFEQIEVSSDLEISIVIYLVGMNFSTPPFLWKGFHYRVYILLIFFQFPNYPLITFAWLYLNLCPRLPIPNHYNKYLLYFPN